MLKGEINPKFFKVSYWEATSWGFEPIGTKYFKIHEDAKRYAIKLLEDLKQIAKESDDYEFIEIKNEKDEIIEAWRAEDGKVIHYPDGW